jgi:hypothetical protein
MSQWTTEITNDPERDYALYMELLEDDEAKARIERAASGEIYLRIYPSKEPVDLPGAWVRLLINDAEKLL